MKLPQFVLRACGVILAASTIACSGSGSGSPTGSTGMGATIQGTVQTGTTSTSSQVSTQSTSQVSTQSTSQLSTESTSAIRVTVMGTELSTLSDGSGRFKLQGVPSGDSRLHFEGPEVDAQLAINGLHDGQVLTLDVRVSGSQATVAAGPSPSPSATPSPSDEVEFRGRIESIGSNQLVVAGRTVHVTDSTLVRRRGDPIPFSQLAVGNLVEVEGAPQADGSVVARKITLEDDDEAEDEVEFQGRIESIGSNQLVVAGRTVHVTDSTLVRRRGDPIPFSQLAVGNLVEVEGAPQADGSVVARKITLEDGDDNDDDDNGGGQVEFRGAIQSITPPTLQVAGRQVTTDGSTRILDDRGRSISLGDLRVGQTVEVEGRTLTDGSFLAEKIKLED